MDRLIEYKTDLRFQTSFAQDSLVTTTRYN
jgi:hypothetical protein